MLAVHDEVDGDLAPVGVDAADGVRPDERALLLGQFVEAVQGERLGQRVDLDVVADDHDLDVRVGELTGLERVEASATEHQPDHVRGQLLAADHLKRVDRTSCHANLPRNG